MSDLPEHPGCKYGLGCTMFWWKCRFIYLNKETGYLFGDARQAMGLTRNEPAPELEKHMGTRLDKIAETNDVMMRRMCPEVWASLQPKETP